MCGRQVFAEHFGLPRDDTSTCIPYSSYIFVLLPSTIYGHNLKYIQRWKNKKTAKHSRTWIAQSVQRLATGWTDRGSNPRGGEIFRTPSDRPCSPPSLLYNAYQVFPGGKAGGGGFALTTHPYLAPKLKKD